MEHYNKENWSVPPALLIRFLSRCTKCSSCWLPQSPLRSVAKKMRPIRFVLKSFGIDNLFSEAKTHLSAPGHIYPITLLLECLNFSELYFHQKWQHPKLLIRRFKLSDVLFFRRHIFSVGGRSLMPKIKFYRWE